MQAEIEQLFDQRPDPYTDEHFQLFQKFKQALNAGEIRAAEPDAVHHDRMARERVGEEGHAARLPHGRHGGHVDRPRAPALVR